jgi:sulfatase modifying factor 1
MFYRSYDEATDMYNDMVYPATVSAFVLDRYEVTVGRFRAFVNAGLGTQASPPGAGAGAHLKLPGSGWDSAWNTILVANTETLIALIKCNATYQTWTDTPGTNENKPMNCVRWYEAMAFCIWDGGYLPTEAEWNYVASGGSEQRAYPWSNPASSTTIDCTYANYNPGTFCVNGTTGGTNRVGSESPKGDGRWGHSDLAGNVLEWTLDWYTSPYSTMNCNDCGNLMPASDLVIRGGSFSDGALSLRVANRLSLFWKFNDYSIGFRCARTP